MIGNKNVVLINLFGVPGAGKSTMALSIASILSRQGKRVELVQEFAKEKVLEGSLGVLADQHYVFAKQLRKLVRVANSDHNVDYIVTDSPVALSLLYGAACSEAFTTIVREAHNSFNSVNILINRHHPYDPYGRLQSEEESIAMEEPMRRLVDAVTGGKFLSVPSTWQPSNVVKQILASLGEIPSERADNLPIALPPVRPKLIIAISGKARTGKNTFARYVTSVLSENNTVSELAFADKIKNVARKEYGWDGSKKGNGRAVLDLVGKLLRKAEPDCLVDNILAKLGEKKSANGEVILVTDVRLKPELEALKKLNGKDGFKVLSVRIESQRAHVKNMPTEEQQRSYTETDLDHVTDWDYVIENNGTPVDFSNEIFKFLKKCHNAGYILLDSIGRRKE